MDATTSSDAVAAQLTPAEDLAAQRRIVGATFVLLLALFWPTLASFPPAWSASYHEHGFFIGGLVAWLVWRARRRIFRSADAGMKDLAPIVALLSIAWMCAVIMNVRAGHQVALVLVLTGWAFVTFGWSARRRILSVALTFVLGLPVWGVVVPVLQRGTVLASGGITHLFGISAFIGTDYVTISSGTFLIEEGCAGINYLMGGLTLGAIYAHLFCRDWRTQLKIVGLGGLVAIIGNWIRVAVLIFIGEATAMQSGLIYNHLWQGWAIFTLLMIPTYFVARRIELGERAARAGVIQSDEQGSDATPDGAGDEERKLQPAAQTPDPTRVRRAVFAAAMAGLGPILFMTVGAIPRARQLDRDYATLRLAASPTSTGRAADPGWRPRYRGIDDEAVWRLDVRGREVEVARYYFIDQRQGEELIQWDNAMAPDSLLASDRLIGPVGADRRFVHEALIRGTESARVAWYWYRVAGFDTPFETKAKLLEILSFFRRAPASELVTLSALCDGRDCAPAADALTTVMGGQPRSVTRGDAAGAPPLRTLPSGVEAISFLGDTLRAPELPDDVRAVYIARYQEAQDALAATPENADSLIWMGRRTAYLGHFRDAIEIYTEALSLHPDDARIYRHRGHRYLTVREPDAAIADFERAAELTAGQPDEVEPDGLPNVQNIPTSTLQFNIWYHLALAHYVKGELEAALAAQRRCLEVSRHPDSVVATSYWLYMTLRRLGRDDEAAAVLDRITPDMEIIESMAYLDLLLLFKGERTYEDLAGPSGEDATLQSTTTAYGLGVWQELNGRDDEARRIWERILTGRNQWPAFGYLAAEAELARAGER